VEEDQQQHLAKVAESHAQIWLSLQEQQNGRYDVEQLQVLLTDEKHQFATKTDELAKVTEALVALESQLQHVMAADDNDDKEKKEQWVKINEQVAEKEQILEATRQRQPPPPVEVKKLHPPPLSVSWTDSFLRFFRIKPRCLRRYKRNMKKKPNFCAHNSTTLSISKILNCKNSHAA
jgi:hypothetical protein